MTARPKIDYSAMDDMALARLCAGRDRDAVRHLVTASNQRLFRAAWSVLKDRAEAEEAVQAGYMRAFAAMDRFEGRSSLSTWMTRIVVNEALGRLRSQRRRRKQLESEGVTLIDSYRERLARASTEPAPDVEIARAQLRLLIEKSVGELPDIFRSVFVLREMEGMSVEETADVLGIQAATVKTRLHRARAKLQDALAPEMNGAFAGSFPFAGADCAAMTDKILSALDLT